jgi:hypothetical protein
MLYYQIKAHVSNCRETTDNFAQTPATTTSTATALHFCPVPLLSSNQRFLLTAAPTSSYIRPNFAAR